MSGRKRFFIALGCGFALAVGVSCLRGLFAAAGAAQAAGCLCDGFFAAAVLTGGLGALSWVRSAGLFDGAAFGVKSAFSRRGAEPVSDSRARKKRGRAGPLLLAGGVLLAVSCAALGVYYLA